MNANYFLLTSIVCLISMQLTALLGRLLLLFPPGTGLAGRILPEWSGSLQPKWDLVLFLVFILAAVSGQAAALFWLKKDLKHGQWRRGALRYLGAEAVMTFLLLSAAYKMTIYDNSPFLAQRAFAVLAIGAVLMKLFWHELNTISGKAARLLADLSRLPVVHLGADAGSLVLIAAVIYVPGLDRVLAQLFIGEQFHHFDFFLMSPGWAYLNGQMPYVDAISQYGVGVVAVLSRLASLFGGFDYLPVLKMLITLVTGYYMLLYILVRYWLGSITLALAAFFVAFRLQMFHYGVSPLCWTYPSTTPVRFGLDIVWLALLLAHLRSGRVVFLALAAVYSGAALYYMTATGMCVLAAFYFYLAALLAVPHLRRHYFPAPRVLGQAAGCGILAVACAFGLFWLTLGREVWSKTFWHNMTEYLMFFAHGHAGGVLPIYESLKYRHFWASFMGFLLPLSYLAALLFIGALVCLKKVRNEHLLAAVIAVYGLANYQYYVVRSAVTSYYMGALPFVLLACFWLALALEHLGPVWRRRVLGSALALSIYALTTNHNYISYPNLFNFSRDPMVDITVAQRYPDRQGYFNHLVKPMAEQDKLPVNSLGEVFEDIRAEDSFKSDEELKNYYRGEFDFAQDARLIQSLTRAGERVAVLSSFETKILLQAKRTPLFYHLPMITSQPMRMRAYPADAAHSPNFLADTLRQLQQARPEYVFIQRIFLQQDVPASYLENNANITAIVRYVRGHYSVAGQGKYLAALKRYR
ncbi:MAG: hypothetical protein HY591_03620 [Candidatus Omnitrophica bacterium]|nr:hypothetical protein [Candidatus Omnitrophota bacterium]